jgi:hypothetical protein
LNRTNLWFVVRNRVSKVTTEKDLSKYPRYEGYEQGGVRARNSDEVFPTKVSDIRLFRKTD